MVDINKFVKAKRFTEDFEFDEDMRQVLVIPASTTVSGKTRLATVPEALAGTRQDIAVTPAGLKAAVQAGGGGGGGGGARITGVNAFDFYTRVLMVGMSDGTEVGLNMTDLLTYVANRDKYIFNYYGWDSYTNSLVLQYADGTTLSIPMNDVINRVLNAIPRADQYTEGKVQMAMDNAAASVDINNRDQAVSPAGLYWALDALTNSVDSIGELNASSLNISIDMLARRNFNVTLPGNRILSNPSDVMSGRSGSIFIRQDSTGSRSLAFGSSYRAAGGLSNLPQLSTAPNAVDRLDYIVFSGSEIHISLTKDIKA